MLMNSRHKACFEHSYFFKVKDPKEFLVKETIQKINWMNRHTLHYRAGQFSPATYPTTSFLTAATLIYAIGAGVTAAAGTRLALQWILDKGFKLFSFQLPEAESFGIVIYLHYLWKFQLGNLRACCLP